MRGSITIALIAVAGCSSLDGRAPLVDGGGVGDGAAAGDGSASSGTLSPTPDRTLRHTWNVSVTATSVRFDASQRLILSIGAESGADRDFALSRLALTGAEDRFASGDSRGFSRAPAHRGASLLVAVPRAMVVDRQGRIVTVGGGLAGGVRDGVVARWLPDGRLDTTFGEGGVTVVFASAVNGTSHIVWRAALTEDDGAVVLAGGDAIPYNEASVGVYARLTAAGALDTTFGAHSDPRFAAFSAIVRDGDGYALAGSSVRDGAPSVLYLDANGRARSDVGDGGAVVHTTDIAAPMVVRAMRRDDDGGLIVAGGSGPMVWAQTPLRLVRFSAQRRPDTSWASRGVLRMFTSTTWGYEMCLDGCLIPWTQGSFLVMGQEGAGFRIFRVLRGGEVDASFAGLGSIGAQPTTFQYVFGMLPDDRGGLWVFYRANAEHDIGAHHFARVD